jgi:hypothetical protein
MRPFLAVVLSVSVSWVGFAQAVPPDDLIPLGTEVEIELLRDVSSESLQAGQAVPFKLVRGLEAHGVTLLPAGAPLNGTVTSANAAGHWGKAGAFDLKLDPVKVSDGVRVRLDFHRPTRLKARGEKAGEAIGAALVMTYYFPLIPVVALSGSRKGKPFRVRTGERYLVYVVGTEAAVAATDTPQP